MSDQKTIVQFLDRAASNADVIDKDPATSKQTWFIAKLLSDRGMGAFDVIEPSNSTLTKREASSIIDSLTKEQVQ